MGVSSFFENFTKSAFEKFVSYEGENARAYFSQRHKHQIWFWPVKFGIYRKIAFLLRNEVIARFFGYSLSTLE